MRDKHYRLIKKEYKGQRAKRSGIPYINHIDEGLKICEFFKFEYEVMAAFCIHPLVQSDAALLDFYSRGLYNKVDGDILLLALEYRRVANNYLSAKTIGHFSEIKISNLQEVNQMLIVDKIQNRKDFNKNCKLYSNRVELEVYFNNWLKRLGISEDVYLHVIEKVIK